MLRVFGGAVVTHWLTGRAICAESSAEFYGQSDGEEVNVPQCDLQRKMIGDECGARRV